MANPPKWQRQGGDFYMSRRERLVELRPKAGLPEAVNILDAIQRRVRERVAQNPVGQKEQAEERVVFKKPSPSELRDFKKQVRYPGQK